MSVPDWVADSVFYQIFPDRFANGDPSNDPPNVQTWGAKPTIHGFQGGDLRGVIQRFDYLLDLGINAVYLNPIFQSTSNHRYNTTDYYRIDPKLGTMQDFLDLLNLAHQHGVRVILDGVFNHCGRGFFAFNDVLENEAYSPYKDWFHIRRFPLDAYGDSKAEAYLAWWGFKSLPKFNTDNPSVRRYLLDVARYWIEQGADGWRLDVPNEIDDDSFWVEFRDRCKTANPDAYLVGEIWEIDPRWVSPGHFDGLMNYPVRKALLGWIADRDLSTAEFSEQMMEIVKAYPRPNLLSHYVPLGSHDTGRIRTLCGGDTRRVRLMTLFQFCFPGAPAIYYGDEIGLEGKKDPDSRRAFPWDESRWDGELRRHYQQLIALRRTHPALRRGEIRPLLADNAAGLLAFARQTDDEKLLVVLNASDQPQQADVDLSTLKWRGGATITNLLDGAGVPVTESRLHLPLPPIQGAVLALGSPV